ncbi:5-methylcytosine restriction system specificity protein McrC [Acinetobacter ursingii]|uniref:5-methylcytosine restriction system specificity protein McrC n=1 Tax=Acinetobacter ursingii TaxID=108980 RepID=UPI003AF45A4A
MGTKLRLIGSLGKAVLAGCLLSRNFPEWSVSGQVEIPIYKKQFYRRAIFPDLIMKHRTTGKVIVLDAKFKKMGMQNNDIDRSDLHQIHSYSGYYQNNLIASGLIYPLSKQLDIDKSYSDTLYGNNNNDVLFIVDGIYVYETQTMDDLIENENIFIRRMTDFIGKQDVTI